MLNPVWLAVCTGNTCRSPLLMHLLNHRIMQLGFEKAVTVRSAGLDAHADGRSVEHERRVLPFAIEGLRTAAHWLDLLHGKTSDLNALIEVAEKYSSRPIREIDNAEWERVTRVLAMEEKHKKAVESVRSFANASIEVLGVEDNAYDVYETANRPATFKQDPAGLVFCAYQRLAFDLAVHVEALCAPLMPSHT